MVTFCFCFCAVFYIHRIFSFQIIYLNETSYVGYKLINSPSFYTDLDKNLRFAHTIIRDIMGVILIFLGNILIFSTMKRTLSKKEKVVKNVGSEKREREISKMVIMSGGMFIIGHTPIFVFYLPGNLFKNFPCFSI